MDTADLLGAPRLNGELDDRQRRGVRDQDRVVVADAVELVEERLLDVEVLDDRLDHKVATGELADVRGGAHSRDRLGALALRELAPLDLPRQRLFERGHHRAGGLLLARPDHDLVAGSSGALGDARAHDAGAHDPHTLDRHGEQVRFAPS